VSEFRDKEDQKDEIPGIEEIEMDEERPDSVYRDEIRDLEIEKLNHRITLLSILIPCLLCAIFLFAYLDVKDRMEKTRKIRARELQELSERVIDRVASVSNRYGKLEKSTLEKLPKLEKLLASIQQETGKQKRALKDLAKSKIDRNVLKKAIKKHSAEIANTVDRLQKELKKQQELLVSLSKKQSKEYAETASKLTALRKELQARKESVANLNRALTEKLAVLGQSLETIRGEGRNKVGRKELNDALDRQGANLQKQIDLLAKKLKFINDELLRLQRQPERKIKSGVTPGPAAPAPEKKPAGKKPRESLAPVPGRILEEEIRE